MLALLLAVLLSLDRDDYVHPRLSPDGKQLAVARVLVRPDGYETTDVLLIDVATGKSRELLGRRAAEKYEVYETYVYDLQWRSNDRVEVILADGDVGGVTLTIDTKRRRVIAEQVHDEDSPLLAYASRYAEAFTEDELSSALAGATPLASGGVIVQRGLRKGEQTSIFILDDAARLVGTVPREEELGDAIEHGGRLFFTLSGGDRVLVVDGDLRTIGTLAHNPEQRARLRAFGPRLFVFVRPCVWEVLDGALVPRALGEDLDDFSFSDDGSRMAISYWKNGRRAVRVTSGVGL